MNDIFSIIQEEDLTPDLQMLSETCGLDVVRNILRNFGGLNFYIPKISRLDTFIERYIRENKNKTLKQLAKELNLSERYLRLLKAKFRVY